MRPENSASEIGNGSGDLFNGRFELVNLHNNHRRRPRFCRDVWFESVEFLELKDLCRATAINRRVLSEVCQTVLDRRKPPREVPALTIDHRGIQVERLNSNGETVLEALPIPEVEPPPEQILGFGSVTFKLCSLFGMEGSVREFLEGVGKFLIVSQELLKEHDILLDKFERIQDFVEPTLSRTVFSQLKRARSIEADICFMEHKVLLESATFRGSRRLRFNNYDKPGLELGEEDFRSCVEWLHSPTMGENAGAPRTLIFCCYKETIGFLEKFVPMVVERFSEKHQGSAPSPKFSVLVLFRCANWEGFQPEPMRLEGHPGERPEDALWLEPISDGSDRFGRPLREIVELVWGMEDRGNFPRPKRPPINIFATSYSEEVRRMKRKNRHVPGALIGKSDGSRPPRKICGFILRRDVVVGPYARPELFEAQRPQIIHFDGEEDYSGLLFDGSIFVF